MFLKQRTEFTLIQVPYNYVAYLQNEASSRNFFCISKFKKTNIIIITGSYVFRAGIFLCWLRYFFSRRGSYYWIYRGACIHSFTSFHGIFRRCLQHYSFSKQYYNSISVEYIIIVLFIYFFFPFVTVVLMGGKIIINLVSQRIFFHKVIL